ncbi:MAG: hypothetical protein AAF709_22190 [Pseudomonadota bacterium]
MRIALRDQESIFVIDDNSVDASIAERAIRHAYPDVEVLQFGRIEDCYSSVIDLNPLCVVLDDYLGDTSAKQTLKLLRRLNMSGRLIVVSGLFVRSRGRELAEAGASSYLSKDNILDDPGILEKALDPVVTRERSYRDKLRSLRLRKSA